LTAKRRRPCPGCCTITVRFTITVWRMMVVTRRGGRTKVRTRGDDM